MVNLVKMQIILIESTVTLRESITNIKYAKKTTVNSAKSQFCQASMHRSPASKK